MTTPRDKSIATGGRYPPSSGNEYKSDGTVYDVQAWREASAGASTDLASAIATLNAATATLDANVTIMKDATATIDTNTAAMKTATDNINTNTAAMKTIIDSGIVSSQLVNASGAAIGVDDSTTALNIINPEHSAIHAGRHFFVSNFGVLSSDATLVFAITTPADSHIHISYGGWATSRVEAYIYGGASVTNGTPVTIINNNQLLDTASVCTVLQDPTIGTAGDLLYAMTMGLEGTNKVSSSAATGDSIGNLVLKPSTTYTFQAKSKDADNHVSMVLNWLEETA